MTGSALPTRKAVPLRQAAEHSSYNQRVTNEQQPCDFRRGRKHAWPADLMLGAFQARSCMAFGYRRRAATAKQLGVLAWWSPFILIIADVALTSGIPVNEYRPDGPEGMPLRGTHDDRLGLRSGDAGTRAAR